MTADKVIEWLVSAIFVAGFTYLCLWIIGLFVSDFEKSVVTYLLIWVMLWDRRHIAKLMNDAEDPQHPTPGRRDAE